MKRYIGTVCAALTLFLLLVTILLVTHFAKREHIIAGDDYDRYTMYGNDIIASSSFSRKIFRINEAGRFRQLSGCNGILSKSIGYFRVAASPGTNAIVVIPLSVDDMNDYAFFPLLLSEGIFSRRGKNKVIDYIDNFEQPSFSDRFVNSSTMNYLLILSLDNKGVSDCTKKENQGDVDWQYYDNKEHLCLVFEHRSLDGIEVDEECLRQNRLLKEKTYKEVAFKPSSSMIEASTFKWQEAEWINRKLPSVYKITTKVKVGNKYYYVGTRRGNTSDIVAVSAREAVKEGKAHPAVLVRGGSCEFLSQPNILNGGATIIYAKKVFVDELCRQVRGPEETLNEDNVQLNRAIAKEMSSKKGHFIIRRALNQRLWR